MPTPQCLGCSLGSPPAPYACPAVFGVFIGFEKNEHRQFHAVAETDCLLYSWDVEELSAMATQCAPVVGAFWRNFVLCQVGGWVGGGASVRRAELKHRASHSLCSGVEE